MTDFELLKNQEEQSAKILQKLIKSLCDRIKGARMEELSENNTVSVETWKKYGSPKNAAEFFLPEEQAKLVGMFLKRCNDSLDFANRLRMLCHKKEISDWESIFPLNPATLQAIEDFARDECLDVHLAWYGTTTQ